MTPKPPVTSRPLIQALLLAGIFFLPTLFELYFAYYSGREFNARIGWFFLCLCLLFSLKTKHISFLIASLFLISGLIDVAYAMVFKGVWTTASVEAIAQSNLKESSEFLTAYFSIPTTIGITFYIVIGIYCLKNLHAFGLGSNAKTKFIAPVLVVLLTGALIDGMLIKQKFGKIIPGFAGAVPQYLKGYKNLDAEIEERTQLALLSSGKFINHSSEPQTYIFIIGESTTRQHMSLYGYPRQTTPQLDARNDLIIFNDIISNYVQTQPSLRVTLTNKASYKPIAHYQALSILDAANLAGFETSWFSNQQPMRGTYSAIAAQANNTQYLSNDFIGSTLNRYDGLLIKKLDQALKSSAPKKAIFLHMMGSHLRYKKRFPESFKHFSTPPYYAYKPDNKLSSEQTEYINNYDNSILYTDTVFNQAIELASHSEGLSAVSIIADHGEDIFDTSNFKGHGPDNVTKTMLNIPFILWLSPRYQTLFSDKANAAKHNVNQPGTLEDFYHFSLELMNIKSSTFKPTHSLLSKIYTPKERIIYAKPYQQYP